MSAKCLPITLVFLFFFITLPTTSRAAEPSEIALGQQLSIFVDAGGLVGFDEIRSPAFEDKFIASEQQILNFGYTDDIIWLRADLAPADAKKWLFEIGPPKPSDLVKVYVLDLDGKLLLERDLRQLDTTHDWLTMQRGFVFELDRSQAVRVFIRLKSYRNFQVPITLWQEDQFRFSELTSTVALGIFYGILIAMMIYNLFLFGVIRDLSYLYYVAYITSQLGYMFLFVDHLAFFYDGVTPLWAESYVSHLGNMLVLTSVLFCRQFLDLAIQNRWLNRFALTLIAFSVLNTVLILIGEETAFRLIIRFTIVALFLLILLAGIDGIRRRSVVAMIYLFSWTPFIIGGMIMLATVQGHLPATTITNYAFQLGVLGEAMLLSIGLGYRVNLLQKAVETSQSLAVAHLQRANTIKEEFLANVSHELRTPLYGILGLAEVVLKQHSSSHDNNKNSQIKDNIRLILNSGQRLTRLVNDLLDFSAMNQESPKLNPQNLDMHHSAALVISLCQPLLGDKDLILENAIPSSAPLVYADADRLQQILFNLISNAIKFTPKGRIVLSAASKEGASLVSFQVSDTGIGIAEQDQKDIFASFQKVDSDYQGTGIGLSVTKQLVEAHGGDISVRSKKGQGAVFEFSLPLAKNNTSQQQVMLTSRFALTPQIIEELTAPTIDNRSRKTGINEPNSESSAHILVVDDEAINLKVFEQQLSDYQVTTALNGQLALDFLDKRTPDLIILDLMMPGINGYELCVRIRERHELALTPVIIVTAKNRVEDLILGFESGCNDYLTKPFFSEELNVRVHNQLQLQAMMSVQLENGRLQAQIEQYAKNELALRLPIERLERLLDNLEDGVIALDAAGTILHFNPAARSLLHHEDQSLLGESLSQLLPADAALDHPLLQHWATGKNVENCLFDAELKTGQDQHPSQTFNIQIHALQTRETILLLSLKPTSEKSCPPSRLGEMIDSINIAYHQSSILDNLATNIDTGLMKDKPKLLTGLSKIESELRLLLDAPKQTDHVLLRLSLNTLLKQCLKYWELSTTKTKIELAMESKIWAITVDDGRLRVRTMDRYLNIKTLPKHPKWRDVVRTAYYVLSHSELRNEQRIALEDALEAVLRQVNEAH